MATDVFLLGPPFEGGEGTYLDLMRSYPPDGVSYTVAGGFHEGAPGVRCQVPWELALNRLVRPRVMPDVGFRALRLRRQFDLVHVHAHPVRLRGLGSIPLVMSEGSSNAVYLGEYLGWSPDRMAHRYGRARRIYRALGLHDRLLAMDRAAIVYVFSEWAREVNLRWGADPAKLEVVAPGFPVPEERARGKRERFTLLFLGTDFERKGGFDVVEAFERVAADRPDVRLVIAGSDPWVRNPDRVYHEWVGSERRSRVLARLAELERQGLVERHASVPAETVRTSLYPEADAFVMPTLAEGFGFTNVEAMSHGLPVISSREGPIPEVVVHEETGLLVGGGRVDELAQAIDRLASNRELALELGAAGRRRFLEHYTLDAFRTRLGSVYARAQA